MFAFFSKSTMIAVALISCVSVGARERRDPCCSMSVSHPESSPCLIRPNECEGPELCPMYPDLDCQAYLRFEIGFLYEQVRVTGAEFAYTVCGLCFDEEEEEGGPGPLVPWSGCAIAPEFDMSYGVTAALGYYACWDNWFLNLRFDWLKSQALFHQECDCQKVQIFVPNGVWNRNMVRLAGTSGGACTEDLGCVGDVCDTLTSNYYMLEANVNRGSFISLALALEPYCGLKTVWTDFCNEIFIEVIRMMVYWDAL